MKTFGSLISRIGITIDVADSRAKTAMNENASGSERGDLLHI